MQPLFRRVLLRTLRGTSNRVFHKSRTHVERFHILGKRVKRPVARSITYRNSFKVSRIGNRTSGEGFTRRENERRERFTHREMHVTRWENERRERGLRVRKRTSGEGFMRRKTNVGEGFTRRDRCVPRIVSFSATIAKAPTALDHYIMYSTRSTMCLWQLQMLLVGVNRYYNVIILESDFFVSHHKDAGQNDII